MSHGHFIRAIREFGIVGTFKKIYKMRTLKFGRLVGVDRFGNQYFENTIDYPYGQHRWVEYSGEKNFYEVDSSTVSAEWHGWLHSVTDDPPTPSTTGSVHKTEPQAIAAGSSAPYKRNLGGVISEFTQNLSAFRPRGYGVGNGIVGGSKPHEELFYTQPGFPLDKRNQQRAGSSRRDRLGFTLKDTIERVRAREAGRAGMDASTYDKYTTFTPTRLALLTASSPGQSAASADGSAISPIEGAEVPSDAREREVAARLASNTGHARPWGKELERGTFAAAAAETLTPEEEEFLAAGYDEDDLQSAVTRYQSYVDAYAGVGGRDAEEGVAKSTQLRDDALGKLRRLREIQAKMARLMDKYDERCYAKAAEAKATEAPKA